MEQKKISGPIMIVPVGRDASSAYKVRRSLLKLASGDTTLAKAPTSDRFVHMIQTVDEPIPVGPVPDPVPIPQRMVRRREPAEDRDDDSDGDGDVDEQPAVASPARVHRVDPAGLPHETWLETVNGDETTGRIEVANLETFWGIIHGTVKNPDKVQSAHFAHGFNEIYKALDDRLGYVLGDTFRQKKIDKATCMYWIINRGYNFVETILESPDLLLYFMENERIDMPRFNVKF